MKTLRCWNSLTVDSVVAGKAWYSFETGEEKKSYGEKNSRLSAACCTFA